MSRSIKSPLPPLALTTIDGKLDNESIGVVAANIVLNLRQEFPDKTNEITDSWDEIAHTVRELALPLIAPRTSTSKRKRAA